MVEMTCFLCRVALQNIGIEWPEAIRIFNPLPCYISRFLCKQRDYRVTCSSGECNTNLIRQREI